MLFLYSSAKVRVRKKESVYNREAGSNIDDINFCMRSRERKGDTYPNMAHLMKNSEASLPAYMW